MLHRERLKPPDYVYPADEWKLIEKRFYPRFLEQMETIFSTANGYLGMRGNADEGTPVYERGTFINGFHETWPIVYGEEAYGFARIGQTMVSVPESKIIRLYVDDEPLYLPTANLIEFERVLDMKAGTMDREVLWETPAGKRVSIKSRRLVSFQHRHLAAILYQVTVENGEAPVVISSELVNIRDEKRSGVDPRRAKGFAHRVLLPKLSYNKDLRVVAGYQTSNSRMTLGCGIEHAIETDCSFSYKSKSSDDGGKVVFSIDAQPGKPVQLTKYMTYHTSRSAPPEELCERAERTLDRAATHGFERILAGQQQYLEDFWRRSDIQIEADPDKTPRRIEEVQQVVRWNLFQLLQASGRAEGAGVPVKGLTGNGYEGHYFWDTEIYVLPFLIYTAPRIARNLLKFRYSMLDKARQRARELNQRGALFPWRTISGEEASAYYAAGTAQYHINADIMYALKKYVNATGDKEFLYREGAEMLVETARLWSDLGFYSERKGGKFCIHGVTGPDEYNTVVDNNTFTNLMARENLWYAAETVNWLAKEQPARLRELVDRTDLDLSEVGEWERAADLMYIPFDETRGINPQDDSFLEKEVWDFENTPADKYPLLLHHHPLVIYRHRVIKQADMVLAMFLLGDEFSLEQKKRNFDYYDKLTTGDSSLSVGIQSIIAAELGYMEKAREYSRYALLMDLADIGGNVSHGCHIASTGAVWMVCVYGFGGMRDYDGILSFNPRLPDMALRLRFPLTVRGQVLHVDVGKESVTYSLRQGDGLVIQHEHEEIRLSPVAPVVVRTYSRPNYQCGERPAVPNMR
ncbi:MAG: glycoside hydrolase family 65 protein [Deltaproteobacteria bacterium]|nr:MAG: glycoside hydrolase family 65 protein [Deltaproteobacteria bacterium]